MPRGPDFNPNSANNFSSPDCVYKFYYKFITNLLKFYYTFYPLLGSKCPFEAARCATNETRRTAAASVHPLAPVAGRVDVSAKNASTVLVAKNSSAARTLPVSLNTTVSSRNNRSTLDCINIFN
jgi:hypothetical protein